MARRTEWLCLTERCDTVVGPVSGGFDRGFVARTQTRICTECKTVLDYTVGVVSDASHRPLFADEQAARANPRPPCAICSSETAPWDRRCPRCGGPMAMGGIMVFSD